MLWNTKVHTRVHNKPTLAPILSQINSAHNLPSHFLKIGFNIIKPYTPTSSKWSLSNRIPNYKPVGISLFRKRATDNALFIFKML
jgi:hypothetical protein